MGLITLTTSIVFLYTLFWLLVSSNKNRVNDWKNIIDSVQKKKNEEETDDEDDVVAHLETEESNPKKEKTPFVLSEIPIINSSAYAKYEYHDFSVRELAYPEEKTRYYAVVTMSGGEFNKTKVNAIIHFHGDNKESIFNYGLIPAEYFKRDTISIYRTIKVWTFDEVKRRLNAYIKDTLNGTANASNENWQAYYSDYACYFDTIEDATYALVAFKQVIDEKLRKKNLSINDVTENIISVKFED